jgi:UDP-N-acetyl-D-mannosaminuronate dehydrogenase
MRAMQKVLVVGLGEVGLPLLELIRSTGRYEVAGFDVDKRKTYSHKRDFEPFSCPVDVLHLAFPCENFNSYLSAALEYVFASKPGLVIVNSTVTPGTTKAINAGVKGRHRNVLIGYSPVRGMPKNDMQKELLRYKKYVAGITPGAAIAAKKHFQSLGMRVQTSNDVLGLELAKIFETSYRAVMIATFQEFHRMTQACNVCLSDALELIADDNKVLKDRPIHYPGLIGGHCLMPNIKLLLERFRSPLFQFVKQSNRHRKLEIKDMTVFLETELVRRRVETA